MKCSQFDSHASLQAVFVTQELTPFRDDLPESKSRRERVDLCLAYLLPKHLSDGRSALLIFLETLRDLQAKGNALQDELAVLSRRVSAALVTSLERKQQEFLGLDYLGALERMHTLVAEHAPSLVSDFCVQESRLRENLDRERYGSTETVRAERAEIVDRLNALARRARLRLSFGDLCVRRDQL